MGRRADSKERTREEILSAAESLFRERGYRATRVRDITGRVGVTEKTFFNYFQGKASLLHDLQIAWFRGEARRAREAYRRIADGADGASVLDTLRADIRRQIRVVERDRDFWALVFTTRGAERGAPMTTRRRTELRAQQAANFEVLLRIFGAAREHGEIRNDLETREIVEHYLSLLNATVVRCLSGPANAAGDMEARVLRAIDVLFLGLSPRRDDAR